MIGSTNSVLQGVPVEPDDVDIQTTEAETRAAETLFGEAVTEPVERVGSERIRSSLGAARVGGVTVELIGGIERRRADGSWTEPPPIGDPRQTVALEDRTVPVLPLVYEARAYERLGKKERAGLFREHA